MFNCPKCGNELPDYARFCNNCGTKLDNTVEESIVEGNKEPVTDDGAGSEENQYKEETPLISSDTIIESDIADKETVVEPSCNAQPSSKRYIKIGAIIAACIVIGLVAFLAGKDMSKSDNTDNNNTAVAEESAEDASSDSEKTEEKTPKGKTVELKAGRYIGGQDIPVGKYRLDCKTDADTSGIVSLSSANDDLDKQFPSLIYEYVDHNIEKSYYIPLQEKGVLDVPFEATLSTVDYMNMNYSKPQELIAGTYEGGKDLPVGKYNLDCKTDAKSSGIVWVSAASDDLSKGFPSQLYEYVDYETEKNYYVSLEEGGKITVPFACEIAIGNVDL